MTDKRKCHSGLPFDLKLPSLRHAGYAYGRKPDGSRIAGPAPRPPAGTKP